MRTQDFLNLQCRDLVATRLDDVDTAAAEDTVVAVIDLRDIARTKPFAIERVTRCIRAAPILPGT